MGTVFNCYVARRGVYASITKNENLDTFRLVVRITGMLISVGVISSSRKYYLAL
jgi:hypothetical protein